ncbi:MAG: Gfo/Idh/MocA family oxidoreductase [Deltaproteobacteria bacterium]|nr:Gfo/Idh/MocA family oxidoreductase [Deltaproteobacteria bacterium]
MSGTDSRPVGVAVFGAGYWGKNYVRNLAQLKEADLRWVVDPDPEARARAERLAPGARVAETPDDALADPAVEAVIVATGVTHHERLGRLALEAGKHTLVEKPLATSVAEATRLVETARRVERQLLVGHLMLYHPAVLQLKELITRGDLGRVFYMYALRVNLGRIRRDENALWSFAPHDLSVIDFLLGERAQSVSARGRAYLQEDVEDVVFVNLDYASGAMAQVQLSWLDPHKERRLTVVGSKKMVVFDDTHATEKLRIYDKGVDAPPDYESYGEYLSLRNGDIHIPHVSLAEPLTAECLHFLACARGDVSPRTPGESGLEIVQILDAAQRSMRSGGTPIPLSP